MELMESKLLAIWRPQYKERIGGVGGARPLRVKSVLGGGFLFQEP